ncbi:MAG: beta-ketoacyl-[acyl-carrier-protein] synthase family protein [Opitutales bacterium]|nr:beta-ketoacyl-[acyl-carrier-protein] synthase family protein [Opitutales bacterium]
MKGKRVVVTGIGLVCPLGYNSETIVKKLKRQEHGFSILPEYADFKTSNVCVGARIPGFSTESRHPEDWTNPAGRKFRKEVLRGLSPHVYYALYAMEEALCSSGLVRETIAEDESTGLFTASGGSVSSLYNNLQQMYRDGVRRTNPLGVASSVTGTLSYNLGAYYKITGSSCGFASACASSAHALGFAFDTIAMGRQKRILVVSGEDGDLNAVLPFAGMHALSTATNPDEASLPFDQRRKGFVGSGGAVTIILEEEEAASQRGAPVFGEILGWGQASDGYNPVIPHPEGRGVLRSMQVALASAKGSSDDIDYINAHATGTPVGDVAEGKAIAELLGERSAVVPVSSTKALTGHPLSMAGAMEVVLSLQAARAGFTPGTANLEQIDPKLPSLYLPRENLAKAPRRILSNSSGFGGANVSLVVEPHS